MTAAGRGAQPAGKAPANLKTSEISHNHITNVSHNELKNLQDELKAIDEQE